MTRRRPAHRLTSALVGAIVTAVGILTMALLSGREVDTELIAIVSLAAVGGWLMLTALLSARRPRSERWGAASPSSTYSVEFSSTPPGSASDDEQPAPDSDEAPLTAAARKVASRKKTTD